MFQAACWHVGTSLGKKEKRIRTDLRQSIMALVGSTRGILESVIDCDDDSQPDYWRLIGSFCVKMFK